LGTKGDSGLRWSADSVTATPFSTRQRSPFSEADRLKFGKPEATYRDKQVCVSGKITSHRDIPEIVINTPSQIRIQK
jgi:hypothetical protein